MLEDVKVELSENESSPESRVYMASLHTTFNDCTDRNRRMLEDNYSVNKVLSQIS